MQPSNPQKRQTQICLNSLSRPLAAAHARPPGRLPVLAAQPRGSLSTRFSHFSHLDAASEGSRRAACQRRYEDTSEMAEQSAGVSLSQAPLSRCFDVMGALCFVMCRSCQISGPVMALSARLLGLTEPVMELRINKRVITFPPRGHTLLSYISKEGGGKRARGKKGTGSMSPFSHHQKYEEQSIYSFCSEFSSKYCIIPSLLAAQM